MKKNAGYWMIGYGAFLILAGGAGFLSNPEKAKTALISGSASGSLAILWGWLMMRRVPWSAWAAAVTTGLLVVVFAWRAALGWMAVAGGNAEKLVAAVLITCMLAASLVMISVLLQALRKREGTGR